MRNIWITAAFTLLVFSQHGYTQTIRSASELAFDQQPLGIAYKSQNDAITQVQLPKLNRALALEKASKSKPGEGPFVFAEPFSDKKLWQDAGKWQVIGDTAVWRVKFTATEAVSLNIAIENLFLPHGAKLFFYTPDGQHVAQFDESHNKKHGQLWGPIFEHNEMIVEINTPKNLQKYTRFEVKQVNQGFRSIKPSALKSGDCNINVICSQGNAWRSEIRSVARIVIGGTGLCTGTMVNNVEQNNRPFFLSANHCGINASTAPGISFYWNFEASQCGMTTAQADGSLSQFQTGSTFRSRHEPSDLALVELDQAPSANFNVHWAGWNNDPAAPDSAVAIHHPAGDEKRISFDTDPLTITNYSSNTEVSNGTHLRVGAWNSGTTEGGSSGSAIWDANKYIVGTLHGGAASCQQTDAPDWYGRVAVQWEGGGTAASQLAAWLDPNDTGAVTLAGKDACNAPTGSISLSSNNVAIDSTIEATATASGGSGSGYSYAWDFNGDGITDATGQTASYSYPFLYSGNVEATITDGNGCAASVSQALVVNNGGQEIFMADGNIPANWSQSSGSDASWMMVSSQNFEGTYSLQSMDVNDNQTAGIQTTVNFDSAGTNFIAFAAKVSSESSYDFLRFYIDGQQQLELSGNVDWTSYYFEVSQGNHTLTWTYEKDESVSEGSDTAWIDGITGIPLENGTSSGGGNSGGGDTGGNTGGGDSGGGDSGGGTLFWLLLLSFLTGVRCKKARG